MTSAKLTRPHRRWRLGAIATSALVFTAAPVSGQQPASVACALGDLRAGESFALVLSGGGAHGIAHIGVLEVLDSLGMRPSLVVGTSMGALVGALYATGLSGRQIDSLSRRLPLEELFRRYVPMSFITSGDLTTPFVAQAPAFVVEQLGTTVRLQSPAARERQVNALFDQLLLPGNLTARGDFSRLPIPFLAVATDMRTRSPVVLSTGDLAQAVRASAAIPIVFAPVALDERMLIDGGLSANVPIGAARGAKAARLVVSDVGSLAGRITDVQSTTGMLAYLLDFLFSQGPYALSPGDVAITPEVDAFGLLNFSREAIGPLIAAGRVAARNALAGCTARAALPRAGAQQPAVNERRIADRLARLMAEGVYESVWLNPRPAHARSDTSSSDSTIGPGIAFTPVASIAPGRIAGVGLAYDTHDGVRAWVASANTALADHRLATSGALDIDEWRQQLLLTATGLRRRPLRAPNAVRPGTFTEVLPDPRSDEPPWSMLTRDLLRPSASITGTREIVRLYDAAGHERARPASRDLLGFLGATAAFSGGWQGAVGPIAHLWREDTLATTRSVFAAGGMLRVARVFGVRTTGPDQSSVPSIASELLWTDHYRRALGTADLVIDAGGFQFRPRASFGAGRDLPLSAKLILGGPAGFPGLMPGERRGDRAAFAALAVMHPFVGSLYWRVDAGRGRTRVFGDSSSTFAALEAQGWVSGVDAGIAADTPLGPLTISYGVSTGDRRVLTLHLGGY